MVLRAASSAGGNLGQSWGTWRRWGTRPLLVGIGLAGLLGAACAAPVTTTFSGTASPQLALGGVGSWGGAGSVGAGPGATTEPVVRASVETQEALEAELFAQVNADRVARGLRPVVFDLELVEMARARAAAQTGMGNAAGLSHDDGVGSLAFRRLLQEKRIAFALAGENLARPHVARGTGEPPLGGAVEVAAQAERTLMASATHRENILEPSFTRLGVGLAREADGQVVFAQIFLAR
jgi:uncharacterized protein YkwD